MSDSAAIETATAVSEELDMEDHPWRRYGGRMIDLSLFSFLFFALLSFLLLLVEPTYLDWLAYPSWPVQYLLIAPVSYAATALFTAGCLSRWGSTPGKFLFGIKIADADGQRLKFRSALLREAHLLWWGLGLGVVPISLFMMIRSYSELENDHRSRWDARVGSTVYGCAIIGWQYAGVVAGTLIVILLKVSDLFVRFAQGW